MSLPIQGTGPQHPSHNGALGLSDRDAAILEFERSWFRAAGARDQEIRERFDLSTTRYFQILNALIDTPAALQYDPLLVKRLRRLREQRQKARSARRLNS